MNIRFSRHARRRARLYKIQESIVEDVLCGANLVSGENEVIKNIPGYRYPVKIVAVVEGDVITVVTNYPLKKGR